ncbi:hypothetical protein CK203_013860 [Vitis vinifera]|uniref:Retrotransposon gag domain-containing protein n=1 Tax=Vitis vinifera TaxID=29760 RepID=A0A438JJ12_VITVI|nr:hypothetical protein CK203_013860 [Vitis vinifera]
MHYRQLMTLDIGNDALLCKVFPASLQGQALSWFHRLPPNSVGNFRDLSKLSWDNTCAPLDTSKISAPQNIKMQDNESLREFVKRFGQAVLQVEACRWMLSYRSSSEASVQALHFSNHWPKSLLQWMTYSDVPTNIQCSKMTYVQPPASFGCRTARACPTSSGLDPWNGPIHKDRSRRCAFHKDHGHTTETCRLPVSGRKAHQSRTFEAIPPLRYWRRDPNITTRAPRAPAAPKAVINYINGGSTIQAKRQKLLRAHQYANA